MIFKQEDCVGSRKIFIIDTSVLLYDRCAIHSFPGNDVIIPLVVLDELDRFKDKPGLLGENARYVNRFLDDLRSQGSLHDGVMIENDQTIRVDIDSHDIPDGLEQTTGDNKIIATAFSFKLKSNNPVVMITKDINFRIKCDALGIYAEDYYKDRIDIDKNDIYTGVIELNVDDSYIIDEFFEKNQIDVRDIPLDDIKLFNNQFVIIKSNSKSMMGVYYDGVINHIENSISKTVGINAKNKEQRFAIDLLSRDEVKLVSMTGLAGSGKTFLTLMAGLAGLQSKKYERIIITRSLQTVGKDIGFLPGDVNEKMSPWLSPILDNFRVMFKDETYFEMMKQKGQIEISPLSFIRGRTFNNTYMIVDEAQNSTIHELKTIITRIGEGSKVVLIGDIDQIDTPYLDNLSNGLTIIVEKFKEYKIAGHITLIKGERSELATIAAQIL